MTYLKMTEGSFEEVAAGPNAVDISPNKDGGVMKEIKVEGRDAPHTLSRLSTPWSGDTVYVHYVGTLADGSKFDSSRDRKERFSFNIGKSEVIRGWDLGVATMKRGEVSVFTVKAEYGYGSIGSPPKIPGGATLVFEIELFDFHGEDISKDKDMSVVKRIKIIGDGYDQPNDGSQVELTLKGFFGEEQFDDRTVDFEVGEGLAVGIPRGIELALEKMKKNEIAEITLKPSSGFGSAGYKEKGVPPDSTLVYEIKLNKFEKAKESWQLDADQKLEQAKIFKEKGTRHFKEAKWEIAGSRYQKVIDFLEHEISLKDEAEVERKDILQAGRLNLALAHLKLGNWIAARDVCDKAIEENDCVAKAWFRRGEAKLALNDCEAAKDDFEKTIQLDPENRAAKNKILICQQRMKLQKSKEKKTFANMFDKFAAIDQKKEKLEKLRRPDTMKQIDQWNSGSESISVNSDPNSLNVGGDIKMNLDLNEAIAQEEAAMENMED